MGAFEEDVLRTLASDKSEEIRAGLASNYRLAPDLQRQLALDNNPLVRAALAGRTNGDPVLLDSLANDKDYRVRIAAAGNALSTAANLRKLAADKKYLWVRRGVAQNAGTPDDLLLKLCGDSDSDIRDIAKKQMQIGHPQWPQVLTRLVVQTAQPLDTVNLSGQQRQQRRLVAAAGANFQYPA